MKRTVAVLVVGALASGCLSGHLPPLELYRLARPDSARVATTVDGENLRMGVAPGAIAIAPYDAPGIYGDRSIVYRIDETEYGAYPSREWALPLSTMLGLLTQDVLQGHPLTRQPAVFDPPSYDTAPYTWRGYVREFEEVDRGREVYAAVRFDARIVRTTDDSVIWSGTVRLERPVPQPTMRGIVDVLSATAAEAVGRLADEARAALVRAGSAGVARD